MLKKLNRQTLTPIDLERVFQRSTQAVDSPPDVTDAPVEQGERKRCKEHRTVPESADSSSTSSSSESSIDTEMGLVDACTTLSENPEAQRRRRGGPVTPDLTTRDFNKADCRTKCRKLVENSEPLLLIGWITNRLLWRGQGASTGGSALGIHL